LGMTMKCEICNEKTASFVIYIIDKEDKLGKKFFLCEDCANKIPVSCFVLNQNQSSPMKKLPTYSEKTRIYQDLSCSYCLTTYQDFLDSGFLGCSHCYETFYDLLRDSISKIQPELIHRGKIPLRLSHRKKIELSMNRMRISYQKCLEEENYEKAEHIKHLLRRLESYLK